MMQVKFGLSRGCVGGYASDLCAGLRVAETVSRRGRFVRENVEEVFGGGPCSWNVG